MSFFDKVVADDVLCQQCNKSSACESGETSGGSLSVWNSVSFCALLSSCLFNVFGQTATTMAMACVQENYMSAFITLF